MRDRKHTTIRVRTPGIDTCNTQASLLALHALAYPIRCAARPDITIFGLCVRAIPLETDVYSSKLSGKFSWFSSDRSRLIVSL